MRRRHLFWERRKGDRETCDNDTDRLASSVCSLKSSEKISSRHDNDVTTSHKKSDRQSSDKNRTTGSHGWQRATRRGLLPACWSHLKSQRACLWPLDMILRILTCGDTPLGMEWHSLGISVSTSQPTIPTKIRWFTRLIFNRSSRRF
jgi:hypothetical protein